MVARGTAAASSHATQCRLPTQSRRDGPLARHAATSPSAPRVKSSLYSCAVGAPFVLLALQSWIRRMQPAVLQLARLDSVSLTAASAKGPDGPALKEEPTLVPRRTH